MRLIEILAKIQQLQQPIVQTKDIAAYLNIKNATASKILARFAEHKHLTRLRSGLWALGDKIDPLMLPEYLSSPFPSYISLQTALYYHGMISQIPTNIYAVSLARSKIYPTAFGTISLHHVQPKFFFGFITVGKYGIKIATPEKALMDFFYLKRSKTKLFHSLPEIELPKNFSMQSVRTIAAKITDLKTRKRILEEVKSLNSRSKNVGSDHASF